MDRDTMRSALIDLRAAFDDAEAVTRDMLRPPRERELGPVLHRSNHAEAHAKIASGLAYLAKCVEADPAE